MGDRTTTGRTWSRMRWLLVGLAAALLWVLRRYRAGSPAETAAAAPPADVPETASEPRTTHVEPAETSAATNEVVYPEEASAVTAEVLTAEEAARILGCGPDELPGLLNGGPSSRESVEQLASQHYRWRRHVHDQGSYWVTLKQASAILGVSSQRLKRLLDEGEVPYVMHRDGVRLMRRSELDAAARATRGD